MFLIFSSRNFSGGFLRGGSNLFEINFMRVILSSLRLRSAVFPKIVSPGLVQNYSRRRLEESRHPVTKVEEPNQNNRRGKLRTYAYAHKPNQKFVAENA